MFFALVIQHANRTRHIILSSVASPALHNIFLHYFIKGTIFWKKTVENKTRVLIFSTPLSETWSF
jgi:hypothetical protein